MHYETVVETRVGTSITVKMQVSQDRPVYNEEKGEKISANAFLLDVEDVEELDDAKVVALASAEAWDAETEEPISIKTVEYDIKPETGNYTVTFATANDTSITVKVLVVAQNRVESKVYQEEIYAMNFFKRSRTFRRASRSTPTLRPGPARRRGPSKTASRSRSRTSSTTSTPRPSPRAFTM